MPRKMELEHLAFTCGIRAKRFNQLNLQHVKSVYASISALDTTNINAVLLEVDQRQNGSFVFSNLLYIEEERFDKMHDAFESLGKPELLKMKGIYDEVIADG